MKLKELRKETRKNQDEVAKELNISRVTYLRYEQGITEPTIDTLCKMADYFRVSLDYLVGRQFANEYGYLTEKEKTLLTEFRKMTNENQDTYIKEARGILLVQNS